MGPYVCWTDWGEVKVRASALEEHTHAPSPSLCSSALGGRESQLTAQSIVAATGVMDLLIYVSIK